MIDAYTIGASLNLTGDIAPMLKDLIKQFETLNKVAKELQGTLSGLASRMERMAAASERMADAWRGAANSMGRASAATGGGGSGGGGGPGGGGSGGGGGRSGGSLPFNPGGDLPRLSGSGAAAAGAALLLGGPGGGGNGRPPMSSGGGLPPFPGSFGVGGGGGPGGAGARIPAALTAHDYALASIGYGVVAGGIYTAEKSAFNAAADVGNTEALEKLAGYSPAQVAAAAAEAQRLTDIIPGLTTNQALKTGLAIRTITGSADAGTAAMESFSHLGVVLGAHGKGDQFEELYKAIQAGELRGAIVNPDTHQIDPSKLGAFVKNLEAAAMATGFRADPSAILQMLRSGGISAASLSDPALFADQVLPLLTLGAAGAGTALQGFGMQFGAGKMANYAGNMLADMGLLLNPKTGQPLTPPELKKYKTGIGQYYFPPDVLTNRDEAIKDPANFIIGTLLPGLKKYMAAHNTPDTLENEMTTAQAVASRIPGGKFIADFIRLMPILAREREQFALAQKRDGYGIEVANDPKLQVAAFDASFTNMMAAIGKAAMPDTISLLKALTASMQTIADFATKHPDFARRLNEIAIGFGLFAAGTAAYSGLKYMGGPMLRVAGAFAAWAPGTQAALGVAGLIKLLGGLSTIGAVLWALKPSTGNAGESDELKKFQNDPEYRKKMMGGDGIHHESYVPRGSSVRPMIHNVIYMDGRKVAEGVTEAQASAAYRPSSGTTRPDLRIGPTHPSQISSA